MDIKGAMVTCTCTCTRMTNICLRFGLILTHLILPQINLVFGQNYTYPPLFYTVLEEKKSPLPKFPIFYLIIVHFFIIDIEVATDSPVLVKITSIKITCILPYFCKKKYLLSPMDIELAMDLPVFQTKVFVLKLPLS